MSLTVVQDRDLPSGTVTFLFTDVEGSTTLLKKLGADAYAEALEEHRAVLRDVFARHRGAEVDTQGDSFLVAFARASDAVAAASAAQSRLADARFRVRMGLNTGEPVRTAEGYGGLVVHTGARICAAANGGQVLLSQATRDLAEADTKDLGLHRLKDLDTPIRIYQLGHADFLPLKSLFFGNLPLPATPFLGREREVEDIVRLLQRDDARLVTLAGPGGTGKTRLAIEAAGRCSSRFPDGITWIPLAPVNDPALVLRTVAHALGVVDVAEISLSERLREALAGKRSLLMLDNLEHLLPEAAADVALLAEGGAPVVLATSRERLQLQAERVYIVPTLSEKDAVELFSSRASAVGAELEADGTVREICARLDNLPLALELAAARMTLFTSQQLLERLGQQLDLLKGGRDTDIRHQTLRATIEWSYDLLDEEERRLFRRLSVFAGGCTYESAEKVCGATPDTLQSLIDKSLLRRRKAEFGPRYWMLETIREYAGERLQNHDDADTIARRHAEWVCELAERFVGMPPWRTLAEGFGPFADELANARRALGWAWMNDEHELALRLGPACLRFWMHRGFYGDAVSWLERSLPVTMSARPEVRLDALRAQGVIAFFVSGNTDLADERWGEALPLVEELGRAHEREWLESMRAGVAWERGELDVALRIREEGLARARAGGERAGEAMHLHWLGEVLADLKRYDDAEHALSEADAIYRELGDDVGLANNIHSQGDLALDRGDPVRAAVRYRDTLDLDRIRNPAGPRSTAYCLAGLASVLADQQRDVEAATVWGAVCAAEATLGFRMIPRERRRYEERLARLEKTDAWAAGRELELAEAEELARSALATVLR